MGATVALKFPRTGTVGPDSEAELLLAPFSRCEANMQYCASSLAATWSLREIVRKGIKDCKFQNAESREYILFMMLECTIVAAAANRVQSDVADHCKLEGDGTLQGFGVMFGYDYVASSLGPFADRFLSKTVEKHWRHYRCVWSAVVRNYLSELRLLRQVRHPNLVAWSRKYTERCCRVCCRLARRNLFDMGLLL